MTASLAHRAAVMPAVARGCGRRLRLFILLLTLLAMLTLLGGCASLLPRQAVPATQAPTAEQAAATPLGRIVAASRPAGAASAADSAASSGFRPLPSGEFAFEARLALMQQATHTLDLQIYHLHRDHAGRGLLRALRDAALRGVRVRLLIDDFYAAEVDDLLAGLASYPGVEVRLFNPLALRWGPPLWRLLVSPGDFELNNHRMHNKLFVADGALALFGGRNVADEYYMGNDEANFIDMDLLAAGAVVPTLSAVFDRYWNSQQAWPLHQVLGAPSDAASDAATRATFDAAVRDTRLPRAAYAQDPLGRGPVGAQLQAGRLELLWAEAQVHADPPEKAAIAQPGKQPSEAMAGLLRAMATARRYVAIVSPYFVPDQRALDHMREARRHGIHLVVVTNSLASTDEPLVHARYALRRHTLLKMGVELHEIGPALVQRSPQFGQFGRSVPRLHAKVAIIDGLRVLVGSVNLDARSAVGNTELGVVIESPPLAAELQRLMQDPRGGPPVSTATYRVTLAGDGQTLQWQASSAAVPALPAASTASAASAASAAATAASRAAAPAPGLASTTDEPGDSAWLRLKLWLQSLLVPERLL
ncbi:phospholipase D-like domain-containing protein [Aquabacterium sp. OR-4]|uniref:phospholipase D-like domain-containing protein n=1 Tax=Aquabacterium sp. OR-4 TaxID=2978127 RepID=UPI0021B2E795|nr:phospholipase D family protein [Aquabacterium sp. OR-4]MDT7834915.1 phospholipase D family protein [Aquabacterium sp. OR-4]